MVTTTNIEVHKDGNKISNAAINGYNPTAISASSELNEIAVGAQV